MQTADKTNVQFYTTVRFLLGAVTVDLSVQSL